jgi:cell shape-determining protein MreC
MIHQFRDKKQIVKRKKIIKNLIFLAAFLLLSALGIFSYFSGALHFIGKPIWKVENSISNGLDSIGYVVHTKSSIYNENENLLKENGDLKISMTDYNILKNENIKLKELLGRVPASKDLVLSNILTKPSYSPYDSIIVDIGSDSGILVGDKVYSDTLVPIGKIKVVYKDTSLVTLYSSPKEVTRAVIDGSNTSVELIGRGGGNFEMTIPLELLFTKGAFVFLPNFQSEIIAVTEEIISTPSDPVKKILLSSPVNIQGLKWVFVERD